MGNKSKIDYVDATWNVYTGCSHASPGCDNCYAEALASTRLAHLPEYAGLTTDDKRWTGESRFHAHKLDLPLRWRKPRTIMVTSMGDLFHESNRFEDIAAVFGVMAACPQHTFVIVTKRPHVARNWFEWMDGLHSCIGYCAGMAESHLTERAHVRLLAGHYQWPLPNVILLASVENQEQADRRIPDLLECPANIRGLSVEPMLGEVDLRSVKDGSWYDHEGATRYNALTGTAWWGGTGDHGLSGGPRLDWIICGGESGPNARPMHPDWVRSLRDQSEGAGVPFYFKQWGEFCDPYQLRGETWRRLEAADHPGVYERKPVRFGKSVTGHLLDEREWRQVPEGIKEEPTND